MIILITGASHTGKTLLAQKILEKYKYPYLSIDHIKMGLIRSAYTSLTPLSNDKDLTNYLWPVIKEIIKTAIENKQNLIVEGCYIPFDWQSSFDTTYLEEIKYICLIMSEEYIKTNYSQIIKYANVIEDRKCDDCFIDDILEENKQIFKYAKKHNQKYILINDKYDINIEL